MQPHAQAAPCRAVYGNQTIGNERDSARFLLPFKNTSYSEVGGRQSFRLLLPTGSVKGWTFVCIFLESETALLFCQKDKLHGTISPGPGGSDPVRELDSKFCIHR